MEISSWERRDKIADVPSACKALQALARASGHLLLSLAVLSMAGSHLSTSCRQLHSWHSEARRPWALIFYDCDWDSGR